MRITYDRYADALYVLLRDGVKARRGVEVVEGVTVDLDADGAIVGFEVLEARARLGDAALSTISIEALPEPEEIIPPPEERIAV
ncbi:MAG: DUF2283 domain-containing protein [Chloroflexi bacterium]|nr:DUF2283 domain-containing protein [Chloroflexota bacterium]